MKRQDIAAPVRMKPQIAVGVDAVPELWRYGPACIGDVGWWGAGQL